MTIDQGIKLEKEIPIIVEETAFSGVRKIAQKVAADLKNVTDITPDVLFGLQTNKDFAILFATLGQSPLLDELIQNKKFDPASINGKREVYQIQFLEGALPQAEKLLVICGSDKRGTIYGMFALSEYIGVTPLHYWGDAAPLKKENLYIGNDFETISKEPSVKYRGFFINDEWPCFGNWTFGKFGGFTAQMYDHVFELLLRFKGNYIWPAMWTSSFALDGPGNLNEELANEYGVVVGASHHEPCLRASEEWDIYRGPTSRYGEVWNYYVNKEGLNNFWEDGLKRSGKYENIAMLGMRGERDSEILGKDATVKDNVDLLKDVIANQRRLMKEFAPNTPQMLALYKEVEEYFYGSEEYEGLKDWDGLDDVILMLCDDNFGLVRSMPEKGLGEKKWGMYYHFDYHGGPISYEWMPSTSYERTWEQMGKAYEHGIRDVWIVNVGDLKFNEVPLNFFMDLAYDFEKWGTSNLNSVSEYTSLWAKRTFASVPSNVLDQIGQALQGYIRLNSKRRPEALNAGIYHAAHYLEADRMLEETVKLDELLETIKAALPGHYQDGFYSMVWLPAKASLNLLQMHLYAAKNHHYAKQGKAVANTYADLVTEAIALDRQLFDDFARFKDGKWKGHELEDHIGFTTWNEDGNRYPIRMRVEPVHKPRMVVSRKDSTQICHKTYGNPMTIVVDDFLWAGTEEVILEVANDGVGSFEFSVEGGADWLLVKQSASIVALQEEITLRVDREKLGTGHQLATLLIKDGETVVAIEISAKQIETEGLPSKTFLANKGIFAMDAHHFAVSVSAGAAQFLQLPNYGRSETGMKVFPPTSSFEVGEAVPALAYRMLIEDPGAYVAEVWTTPANPVKDRAALRFLLNGQPHTAVPADFVSFHSDPRWCEGVLDNIRKTTAVVELGSGIQEIVIGALDAGLVIERIFVYKDANRPAVSYLGPKESYFTS